MTALQQVYWANLCALRGFHVISGVGCGTSPDTMLWPTHCSTCGDRVVDYGPTAIRGTM